jgi:hypothetical protein
MCVEELEWNACVNLCNIENGSDCGCVCVCVCVDVEVRASECEKV